MSLRICHGAKLALIPLCLNLISTQLYGGQIWNRPQPQPQPQPQPEPQPNPTPPAPNAMGVMQFAVTAFANMEHGWHILDHGYSATCTDSQGVVAKAIMSIDAAINAQLVDGNGAYQSQIFNPKAQYIRNGATSGQCKLDICLDRNFENPNTPPNCENVASTTGGDSERAISFSQMVPYQVQGNVVSLQTGAPGLSAFHPAFVFAAVLARAFKDFQSPLVLNLEQGEELDLKDAWDDQNLARFDLSLVGKTYPVGWIGKKSGLLVVDWNNNGKIDNGSELFGEYTKGIKYGSKTFANGFEALKILDSNNDGVIDGRDRDFGRLRIWRDLNGNAQTDVGELKSLSESQVKLISLKYKSLEKSKDVYPMSARNEIRLEGYYETTSGEKKVIADVWFKQRRLSENATAMTKWLMKYPSK